jgi:LPXTG-site transpeptidase (sortase) family protein
MKNNFNTLKFIISCIVIAGVVILPIIGIFSIWNFKPNDLIKNMQNLFRPEDISHNNNFTIESGEDTLLPETIIANKLDEPERSNPATKLIISSAQIDGTIVYGSDGEKLLREGFWHYPASAYPGEKGVSIIFGHRRYHLPPRTDTFYNLDKVNSNDMVQIELRDGTWLEYRVIKVEIINPEGITGVFREESNDYLLKFITCTPLGTSNQRLIVTAKRTI